MHVLRVAWRGLLLALIAGSAQGASPEAAQTAPPSSQGYTGHWQVRQVLLDEARTDRLLYQRDDPRLVGRTVSIDERRIDSDLPEASPCAQPVFAPEPHTTLDTLLAQTMLSVRPGQAAARAFGLAVPGASVVDAAWTACATGRFGPSLKGTPAGSLNKPGRTWLARLDANRLLMRWYGETVLVLEPSAPGGPAHPSFSCGQARLPAEQAICASPALASYDVSLARAWEATVQACQGEAACLNEARRGQKQWVGTRNRCARDEACLRQAMKARLDALMAPAED